MAGPAAILNAGRIEEVEEDTLFPEGVPIYHVRNTYGPFDADTP